MLAVPALHPAFLLRSSDDEQGQARFESTTIGDFRKAVALLKRRPAWDERSIWEKRGDRLCNLFPTVEEVLAFVRDARGKLLAVDVETTGEHAMDCRLVCIGMASANGKVLCFPVLKRGGAPYWDPSDWAVVSNAVRELLADAGTPKVAHNFQFDCLVLDTVGCPVGGLEEDTMAAHHVLDGELPHGLAFVGSVFLEVPFWKDLGGDVKGDLRWLDLPDEELRSYNLRDCLVTIRALPILLTELERWGLIPLYREEIEACRETLLATKRGLKVDPERRLVTSQKLAAKRDSALAVLKNIAGPTFNPASPKQLQEQLFDKLKLPVVLQTKKGAPSTNKEAMTLLALHAREPAQVAFLRALVNWRVPDKQLTTWVGEWNGREWVGGFPILADGRLHPSWKLLTVTGRFSSSPNAQNWNELIKSMFGCDDGNELVGVDLAQCEVLGISYFANDQEILGMYVPDANGQKINLHTVNTTLLFGVRNRGKDTNARTEAYLEGATQRFLGMAYGSMPVAPNDGAWKAARTLAKNFRFGWQYGAIADTLYKVIRAKRDPETNEPLFNWVTLGQIEAAKLRQEQIDPAIPHYWEKTTFEIQRRGYARCPLSGRIRWFRGGFKRNEMLNYGVQTLIGSHMNKAMIRASRRIREGTVGEAGLICQVHDMLGFETPKRFTSDIKRVLQEELDAPFALPGYPQATLPCDAPKSGRYLNEV